MICLIFKKVDFKLRKTIFSKKNYKQITLYKKYNVRL